MEDFIPNTQRSGKVSFMRNYTSVIQEAGNKTVGVNSKHNLERQSKW